MEQTARKLWLFVWKFRPSVYFAELRERKITYAFFPEILYMYTCEKKIMELKDTQNIGEFLKSDFLMSG